MHSISRRGTSLDVGCGSGKILVDLREQGWQVYGVDFSPVAVDYARTSMVLT